jgi:hypothetical protein
MHGTGVEIIQTRADQLNYSAIPLISHIVSATTEAVTVKKGKRFPSPMIEGRSVSNEPSYYNSFHHSIIFKLVALKKS